MARQVGPIFITGTIGGVSFYKSGNDYFVRMKGGPTKKQYLRSPSFVRTRENISEFAACSSAGAFLRRCLRGVFAVGDSLAYQRMTQVMTRIKNHDRVSPRGKRCVGEGLKQEEGKELLYGFAFNVKCPQQMMLLNRPVISRKQEILADARDLVFPAGASHAMISAVRLEIDLEGKVCKQVSYPETCVCLSDKTRALRLSPKETGTTEGNTLYFLQVRFYAMEQGILVSLEKGEKDSLGCIAIDPELDNAHECFSLEGVLLPFEVKRPVNVKIPGPGKETMPVASDAPG